MVRINAVSIENPLKKAWFWTLGVALATAGLIKTYDHFMPVTAYHGLPTTAGQTTDFISATQYQNYAIPVSIGAQSVALPYEALAGAPAITEQVTVPCFSTVPGAKEKIQMTLSGVDFSEALAPQIAQAKEAGYSTMVFSSKDNQHLHVPIDGSQLYLSASVSHNNTKFVDTPYDVFAVKNKEMLYLGAFSSVSFSNLKEFGFVNKDMGTSYEYNSLDVLLKQKGLLGADSIPLTKLGEGDFSIIGDPYYQAPIAANLAQHATLVFDGKHYDVVAPHLGPRSEVRDITEIGIAKK